MPWRDIIFTAEGIILPPSWPVWTIAKKVPPSRLPQANERTKPPVETSSGTALCTTETLERSTRKSGNPKRAPSPMSASVPTGVASRA
jgi:hypothetical protein